MINQRKHTGHSTNRHSGFTIIELLISVVLAAILVGGVYTLYVSYSKVVMDQDDQVEMQQNARSTMRTVKNDLLLVGRNVRSEKGQPGMLFASPWEIAFNADITDQNVGLAGCNDCNDPAKCVLYPEGADIGDTTCYEGGDFSSKAETIHYFMYDATVENDTGPMQTNEEYSLSPYDREIRRKINAGPASRISYGVRGRLPYQDGFRVQPLFSFWGDFDLNPSTPDTLWGDTDPDGAGPNVGDGVLSQAELLALYGEDTYTSPAHLGGIACPGGAIYLNKDQNNIPVNTEDANANLKLDPGEDLNDNGRLDTNLLDLAIHSISMNVTTISRYRAKRFTSPHESTYHFREYSSNTIIYPRNLSTLAPTKESGDLPEPVDSLVVTQVDCEPKLKLVWSASYDEWTTVNITGNLPEYDIIWYEVWRSVDDEAFEYLTFVPASGAKEYEFIDSSVLVDLNGNIEEHGYEYRISVVDKAHQNSLTTSGSLTLTVHESAPQPVDLISSWNTPCWGSNTNGSITLQWLASPTSTVTEYYVYRGDAEDTTGIGMDLVAKVELADINNAVTCDGGGSESSPVSERTAMLTCAGDDFFTYWGEYGKMYVWRDSQAATGKLLGSTLLSNGHQYGLDGGKKRYNYTVRAFDEASGRECLSEPVDMLDPCNTQFSLRGRYCDSQSYNYTLISSVADSRYDPPKLLSIEDESTYIEWDTFTERLPQFSVTWERSKSESNTYGGACNSAQNPVNYYLILRSRDRINPSDSLFDYDQDCDLDMEQYTGTNNDIYENYYIVAGMDLATATLPSGDPSYVDWFTCSGNTCTFLDHNPDDPADMKGWYLDSTTENLQPDLATGQTISHIALPTSISVDGADTFEYLVIATNIDSMNASWSYAASCPATGSLTDSCSFSLDPNAFIRQKGVREAYTNPGSYDDGIEVHFSFGSDPPDASNAEVILYGQDMSQPTRFVELDRGAEASTDTWNPTGYMLRHEYEDQEIPKAWRYQVKVECSDGSSRYVWANIDYSEYNRFTADPNISDRFFTGRPDPPETCFKTKDTACATEADLDCADGEIRFDYQSVIRWPRVSPTLSEAVTALGVPQEQLLVAMDNLSSTSKSWLREQWELDETDPQYIWFGLKEYRKSSASTVAWPWCDYATKTDPYGGCGDPPYPNDPDYPASGMIDPYMWYARDWAGGGVGYHSAQALVDTPSTGSFRWRFTESVNPHQDFWFQVETRIDHGSDSPASGEDDGTEDVPGCQSTDTNPGTSWDNPNGWDNVSLCSRPGGRPYSETGTDPPPPPWPGADDANQITGNSAIWYSDWTDNNFSYEHIQCYPIVSSPTKLWGVDQVENYNTVSGESNIFWDNVIDGNGSTNTHNGHWQGMPCRWRDFNECAAGEESWEAGFALTNNEESDVYIGSNLGANKTGFTDPYPRPYDWSNLYRWPNTTIWNRFSDRNGLAKCSPGSSNDWDNYVYEDFILQFHAKSRLADKYHSVLFRGDMQPETGYDTDHRCDPSACSGNSMLDCSQCNFKIYGYELRLDFRNSQPDRSLVRHTNGWGTHNTPQWQTLKQDFGLDTVRSYWEGQGLCTDCSNNWWIHLVMVCSEERSNGQIWNHIYAWSRPDLTKALDWQKTITPDVWANGNVPVPHLHYVDKDQGHNFLRDAGGNPLQGRIGLHYRYTDATSSFNQPNNFRFDNMRVTKYCGRCPLSYSGGPINTNPW